MHTEYREVWAENFNYIVILSGGFDPIHKGHIQMIADAYAYGKVFVLLNSDNWLNTKKGKAFIDFEERKFIVENIKGVFKVLSVDDSDGTVCAGLKELRKQYPDSTLTFANGGDRKENNVPEVDVCNELGINLIWNIGGDKVQSSSDLLNKWTRTFVI